MPDPWDRVQPIGKARDANLSQPAVPAPPSAKPHPLDARMAELDEPATVPELIGMMSTLARQLYGEATNTDKKSYEREHLGRTFASLADKLSDLLAKPTTPASEDLDALRPATHDLAAKLATLGVPSAARPAE